MTAVSLINPYAPQPAQSTTDIAVSAPQSTQPISAQTESGRAGLASDQSGQGAGNGTGTGGAQLATLLERGKAGMAVQRATPKSVVEAQSEATPTTEYLARMAQAREAANAEAKERRVEEAARDAEIAAEKQEPEFEMPNPLPTAPILQKDDD